MLPYVLLIDDDPDEYLLLKDTICSWYEGLSCYWCRRLSEAVALLAKAIPSLVLVDYKMGATDGISVIKALRKLEALANVRILLYSTVLTEKLCSTAAEAGADGCLDKCFSLHPSRELQQWIGTFYAL